MFEYIKFIQRVSLLNSIKIALMLSHPNCYSVLLARKPSNMSSSTFYGCLPVIRSFLISSISPWLSFSYLYQTPSHPKIMKSSSLHNSIDFMSGLQVTACLSYVSYLFFLYYKSPNDLDKFKWLFIRPF